MNTSSNTASRSRPFLSMPLAIVIAAALIAGTILAIYLVDRGRERAAQRRAVYSAWLQRVEKVNTTMQEFQSIIKDDKTMQPGAITATAKESLSLLSRMVQALEDSRPPSPE